MSEEFKEWGDEDLEDEEVNGMNSDIDEVGNIGDLGLFV